MSNYKVISLLCLFANYVMTSQDIQLRRVESMRKLAEQKYNAAYCEACAHFQESCPLCILGCSASFIGLTGVAMGPECTRCVFISLAISPLCLAAGPGKQMYENVMNCLEARQEYVEALQKEKKTIKMK